MKRQAATAIPGGVTSGKVERGKEPKLSAPATSAETDTPSPKQQPLPPIVDQNKSVALKEEKAATAVAAGEGASPIETKTVGEAKPTAATLGQGATPSVIPKAKEVSGAPQAVVGTDSSSASAAGGVVEPVVAQEGKAAASVEKKKKKDGVGPETTAAEKVFLLLSDVRMSRYVYLCAGRTTEIPPQRTTPCLAVHTFTLHSTFTPLVPSVPFDRC